MTDESTTSAPQWLKAELFEDLLKKIVNGYKQTKSFKVLPGVGAGENYGTVMLRVEFEIDLQDGNCESLSLMLKVCHDNETFNNMMKNYNTFDVEHNMYGNIVPELEQIYRDVGVDVQFGAGAYTIDAPTDYVLLEDLKPKGFKNVNRLESLDIEHTKSVLRKLAQWHAASAVRVAVKGPYGENLIKGLFKEECRDILQLTTENIVVPFVSCVPTYKEYEEYFPKIKAVQGKLLDIVYDLAKVDPKDFNVLNHGDLWSNNIMFQYDDFGKIKETYFVDYQMPKYGCVAQDLLYFLISSTKLEIKLSMFDYFIRYYHENLIKQLKILKYSKPLPKLRDIHAMLFKYGAWGYRTATFVLPGVLLEPMDSISIDNVIGESAEALDFKKQIFISSIYRKHIEAILPWLHNRGAIDI